MVKLLVFVFGLGAAAVLSITARMQTGTVAPQTAGQKFKNIKALNDVPADQLGKIMNIMGASLGVGCSYCHTGYDFPKDDNPKKEVARRMLRMTFALNRDNFGGRTVVSCNTCHNGSTEPNPRPQLDGHAETEGTTPPSTNHPTATAIIDRYERVLGTPEARARIRSRHIEAERIEPDGSKEKEEIWQLLPDKMLVKTTYPPNFVISEGFDGQEAWKASNGEKIELKADEIEQIRQNALVGSLALSRIFQKVDFAYRTAIEGRRADVLAAEAGSGNRDELYFDCESGLLVRRESALRTVLGDFVYRVDFGDYEEFEGVKLPRTTKFAMPGVRFVRRIVSVRTNVPIELSIFAATQSQTK
jgi:photosynthetic reaction center cytochrome c subunit